MSVLFRRADIFAECETEAGRRGVRALGEGRSGDIWCAVRFECVFQEVTTDAVAEECHGLWTVLRFDLLHFVGYVSSASSHVTSCHTSSPRSRVSGSGVCEVCRDPCALRYRPFPGGTGVHAERIVRVAFDFSTARHPSRRQLRRLPEADVAVGSGSSESPFASLLCPGLMSLI